MSDNQLHLRIEEALKAIIPFALQADEILEDLTKTNMAKFQSIFPENAPFKAKGNRFLPYVEELDKDFKTLPEMDDQTFEIKLTELVKKMEAMQTVLQRFHELRDYTEEEK
ncbi:hypothetical protein NBRC116188_26450 [Oceaniserpentilla sp. 4NH20-0058]|uniref:hypothetical protein n=1 Tax=Oceaniserpentilla sp. 4NH20-0058 TaxID=3127660 RepID=UPI0031093936